jgi:hypothetical protein
MKGIAHMISDTAISTLILGGALVIGTQLMASLGRYSLREGLTARRAGLRLLIVATFVSSLSHRLYAEATLPACVEQEVTSEPSDDLRDRCRAAINDASAVAFLSIAALLLSGAAWGYYDARSAMANERRLADAWSRAEPWGHSELSEP